MRVDTLAHRKNLAIKTEQLAREVGKDPGFAFGASTLVRNVSSEAFELQSRIGHLFRIKERMDWSGADKAHLGDLKSRLAYCLKTVEEIEASAETVHLIAAE